MNVLFIDACIRVNSRTRKLCEDYISSHYSSDDTIDRLVLSHTKLNPINEDTLKTRDAYIQNLDYSSTMFDYAKQFASVDEIVIGAPLWDCSFPSILKVYFENICVSGITFNYDEKGNPMSLCHAKKLLYIATCGGYLPENNSLKMYMKELCGMFSIPIMRFYAAQGLDIYGNHPEEILEHAKNEIMAGNQ